jgi:hypothetical protein
MCDPCRERVILRAAKALARSPAARCIDPDAEMPWLPFTADGQRIRTKALDEPLRDVEARELRRYIDALREVVGPRVSELEAVARDWKGTPEGLVERIRSMATGMRTDMAAQIAEIARPYAAVMADAGARAALATLPAIPAVNELVDFGQANPLAVQAAARSADRMAQVVSQHMAERVAGAVATGVEQGLSIPQIADAIAEQGFSDDRATMIARTESAYAYSEGRIEAWKETGVVQGKQWLLSPDACEFCEAAAAQFSENAIGLDDDFYAQGTVLTGTDGGRMTLSYRSVKAPPLHPNCRCDTTAALDPRLFEE